MSATVRQLEHEWAKSASKAKGRKPEPPDHVRAVWYFASARQRWDNSVRRTLTKASRNPATAEDVDEAMAQLHNWALGVVHVCDDFVSKGVGVTAPDVETT